MLGPGQPPLVEGWKVRKGRYAATCYLRILGDRFAGFVRSACPDISERPLGIREWCRVLPVVGRERNLRYLVASCALDVLGEVRRAGPRADRMGRAPSRRTTDASRAGGAAGARLRPAPRRRGDRNTSTQAETHIW